MCFVPQLYRKILCVVAWCHRFSGLKCLNYDGIWTLFFKKKVPKYNSKMSEHKLVPSKIMKSTLGECSKQSLVCEFFFRRCGHFLYSCIWYTDYNVMPLKCCIASDVRIQSFP